MTEAPTTGRSRALWIALLAHMVLATSYALLTPSFEGPDETDHAYHAAFVSHRQTLPRIKNSGRTATEKWDEVSTGHHPPLYYALLAATMHACGMADTVPTWTFAREVGNAASMSTQPNPETASPLVVEHGHDEAAPRSAEQRLFVGLRLWSVLFGLVTLVLTHRLALVAFPGRPAIADVAVLLLACNPQWSFQHAVLDNGNLATMFTHAAVLGMALAIRADRLTIRGGIGLGILCALALLTKLNSLTLIPLAGATVAWLIWRAAGNTSRWQPLRGGIAAGLVVLAMTGWFFWRNALLYDGDVLGQQAHRDAFATNRIPTDMVWPWLTGDYLPLLFQSSIGNLGWNSVPPPRYWTLAAYGVVAIGLMGWLMSAAAKLRHRTTDDSATGANAPVLCLLLGAALLGFALVTKFNIDFFQPQGRYLFPAFGSLNILLAAGLVAAASPLGAVARSVSPPQASGTRIRAVLPWTLPLIALGYLWLHGRPALRFEPVADAHYTSWTTGLVRGGQETGAIEITGDAPNCRWRDRREPDPKRRYAVTVFSSSGRILIDTHWMAPKLELHDHWSIAEAYLQALPTDEELWWRVREVPNRSKNETVTTMACSPARQLLLAPR